MYLTLIKIFTYPVVKANLLSYISEKLGGRQGPCDLETSTLSLLLVPILKIRHTQQERADL